MVQKHVVADFIKRHHLKYHRLQQNKKKSKEAFREKLVKRHAALCEKLVQTGAKEFCYKLKLGYYKPNQQLNVDQSPLTFTIKCKKTNNILENNENVWVNQPTSDAGKRFCSLTFVLVQTEHSHRLSLFLEAKENKYHWLKKKHGTLM